MNKEIYFCIDKLSYYGFLVDNGVEIEQAISYEQTDKFIAENRTPIVTTSLLHLSYDLIDKGYSIYLCHNDKHVKVEEEIELEGYGWLCRKHVGTLLEHFQQGVFNKHLGICK